MGSIAAAVVDEAAGHVFGHEEGGRSSMYSMTIRLPVVGLRSV